MKPFLLPLFSQMLPLLFSLGLICMLTLFSARPASASILGFRDGFFSDEEVLHEGEVETGIFSFCDDQETMGADPIPRKKEVPASNLLQARASRDGTPSPPIAPILLSMTRPAFIPRPAPSLAPSQPSLKARPEATLLARPAALQEEKSPSSLLLSDTADNPPASLLLAEAPVLQSLSDHDLGDVTAGSIVNFSMDTAKNYARMDLDVYIETHMEIEKFRAGYHKTESGDGWDQSWDKVRLYGNNASDYFKAYGLTLVAEYDGTGDNRKLARILFGSPQVSGKMTATFNSFSGVVGDNVVVGNNTFSDNGKNPYRTDLGEKTISFTGPDQGLFLGLTLGNINKDEFGALLTSQTANPHPGFAIFAGKPLNDILNAGRSDWWNRSPGNL